MKTQSLKSRILIPLTLAFAVLLGAFIVSFYLSQREHMANEAASTLQSVEQLFMAKLDSDASMMGAALHMLLRDERLKAAMKAKDRKALLDLMLAPFGELYSTHGITHLYFTGPDRINILRVHKPDRYGDKIDRFTTLDAEKTGKLSYGIELGPLGTFTLRVVEPWYDGQQLIGYVELGEEIEHITRKLHKILGVEVYVVIEKQFLDRENWETGMRMLGRDAEWNRFPSVVMVDQTHDVFPESLAGFLREEGHTSKVTDVGVSLNDRHYRSRFIHMYDASGRGVGDMAVMTDVTDLVAGLRTTIFFIGAICLVVGGTLFRLFYTFVGRVEQQITTASEKLIRISRAVEGAADAIIIADPSGQPIYQNKASWELFGYTTEDLKAAGGPAILYSDPAVAVGVSNAMARGNSWHGEVGVRTPLGHTVPVSLRVDTIRGESGEIAGFIIIHTDMSERIRAEEALRESEEKYRLVVDNANEAIMVAQDGMLKFLNPKTSHFIGYSGDELTSRPFVEFIHPEDRQMVFERHQKRLQGEKLPETYPFRIVHKNGNVKWVEIVVVVITWEGRPATLNFLNDITERKRAEEALRESEKHYRETVDAMKDWILVVDPDLRIVLFNEAFMQVNKELGLTTDVIGRTPLEIFPFLPDTLLDEYRWVFENKEVLITHETTKIAGREFITESRKIPLLEDGRIVRVVSVIRDITESKRLESQLQQSQKLEAIGTLAGGIAHEFNNALMGISGNVDLLQINRPSDKNIDKYVEPMKDSIRRMASLTQQLLAYARGGKYRPQNIFLRDFVQATVAFLRHSIDPAIQVDTDLADDISNVEADITQLQIVLSAVIKNSAEAIQGQGRIRIITRDEKIDEEFAETIPDLKSGHYVCLTIEDDGKGMDEDTKSRVFDPFFTTKFQGRGLGMAAVYGIIKNHDGWVSIDSELDKGTAVRIYLPAVEVQVQQVREAETEVTTGTGTILVIEDENIVINVISPILEKLGYHILLAKTGKEAVDIARTFDGDIDLAILDIVLPDMGGKQVYSLIMETRPNLKVIVCSGYSLEGPAQEILDAGAQDFIQKPFSLETLSQKLKEVLGRRTDN